MADKVEAIEDYEKEALEQLDPSSFFGVVEVDADTVLATIARLRRVETDNANMARLLSGYHQICSEAGIARLPLSEIYAAAERATQGGENG